jgi:multicomponent Na+:H+ antiporter subunit A
MTLAVLSLFAIALLAPWINRVAGKLTGGVLALGPLACFIYFASFIPAVGAGEVVSQVHGWAPGLEVNLSFYLDGLSLIFALLITGIGTLIVFYAGAYLEGHPDRGRFFLWLIMFMASMLGLVTADNIITMFIFWELTSITSYMLIGFDHHLEDSRRCALQALLVTAAGGLAMLAGLVMVGILLGSFGIEDSFELSVILNHGEIIREPGWYLPIVILILIGCFTKSAQFPFHFWLPNAMAAPTPVSAYLHSSTMVKAGVYLLARMSPALGETDVWMYSLVIFGGATMVIGAAMAVNQAHLKKILAYSTVSALGILVMLIGLASGPGSADDKVALYAAKGFGAFLLAHALYKATLFLVAGTITHETDEKDVTKLGGLHTLMPLTAAAGGLAALSMAGIPPFFGFISKELLFETTLEQPAFAWTLTIAAQIAGILFVVVALLIGWKPFFGALKHTPRHPHEAPFPMWIGPAILAAFGLLAGVLPGLLAEIIVAPTAASVIVAPAAAEHRTETIGAIHLALWHGVNLPLIVGTIVIVLGIVAYLFLTPLLAVMKPWRAAWSFGPEAWYERCFDGMMAYASGQTRILQSGYLRMYLLTTIAVTVGLTGFAVLRLDELPLFPDWPEGSFLVYLYNNLFVLLISAMILLGAYGAVHSRSRLSAIASLGVVGFGVALIYSIYAAPDLAITQFLVETLTVILFVLVFYHLPEFPRISNTPARVRDLIVACTLGVMMTVLVLLATNVQTHQKISGWFAEQSVPLGHGRNIVNVILVDFRATDTLGEIVVLAISAIGVFALLKLHPGRRRHA